MGGPDSLVIPAILVLGAPRTGTSCVAGMLAAAGARVPGPMVRNWDNAKGHFEAAAAVRLSDRVLSLSGGSWMQAPSSVRWDAEAETERDRLMQPVDGAPTLLKDPRMLLCWSFWSDAAPPHRLIGTVRHPLAAARSMSAWRRMPLDDGLSLWLAHCRVLLELARTGRVPLIDLDAEPMAFLERMSSLTVGLADGLQIAAMAAHYDPKELHHDGEQAGTSPRLDEALAVHTELLALMPPAQRRLGSAYPWSVIERIRTLLAEGALDQAVALARTTIDSCSDPVAVLLPLAADLLRVQATTAVLDLCDLVAPSPAVSGLLRGKALLAAGRAAEAVEALQSACVVDTPFWEARSLLAQALHAARRHREARALLISIAPEAVHPASCLSTAAEWAWRDHDHDEALSLFAKAIASSPPHRRGRLRCRRAELLRALGRSTEADADLRAALAEDPGYARARELALEADAKTAILPPAFKPE